MVYYNYRHYNTRDGRWIGRDIIITYTPYSYANNKFSNLDVLGLYTPQPELSAVSGSECAKRQLKKLKEIKRLARKYNKKPTCNLKNGCELVTIFIETGNPCDNILFYLIGHAGIAIGDTFHDLGPGNDIDNGIASSTRPWWADNRAISRSKKKLLYAINNNKKFIHDVPNLVISIEFCVCKEQAEKISEFWTKLNQDMKSQKGPKYAFVHPKNQSSVKVLNCTSSVCESLNLDINEVPYPEIFLKTEILSQLHSTCGDAKGHRPHISVIKDKFNRTEPDYTD